MNTHEIVLFYKYVHIENTSQFADQQRSLQLKLGLKGRTIIANEGINATLEGLRDNIDAYLKVFLADPRFSSTHIKRSPGTGNAFPKTSIKVRSEIVSLGLGTCDVDPNKITGIRLAPAELHEWLRAEKEFYIVDMRNAYEHEVGHFQGSILPAMDNFRDLPNFLESISHLKHKTILTVCTGGVRCEKASGYLLTNGFTNVYQLDGGIVSYMQQYPNEDFVGKLYVFDSRMMMGFYTDDPKHQIIGKCTLCQKPTEQFGNCDNTDCHRQLLICQECSNARNAILCPQGCKAQTRNLHTASLKSRVAKRANKIKTYAAKRLKIWQGRYVVRYYQKLFTS